MDMKTLAAWTSTDPKTCFDTSKNQTLTGRCGRSLHRLYTSDSMASPPSASCTSSAKGPRSRHSPLGSSPSVGAPVAVGRAAAAAAAVVATVARSLRASGPVGVGCARVVVAVAARSRTAFSTAGWTGDDMGGSGGRPFGGEEVRGGSCGSDPRRGGVAVPSPGSRVGEVDGDCHEGIITGGRDCGCRAAQQG